MHRFSLSLAACFGAVVAAADAAQAAQAVFVCDGIGDGSYIVMIESPNTDSAQAIYLLGMDNGGGASVTPMQAAVTGSGFRYVGGALELRGKGAAATLTDNGFEVPCETFEKVAGAPVPSGAATDAFPKRALAMGGNLRAGPGTQFSDVGSVAYETEIVLLQDTGIVMDGYTWFRIQLPNGVSGFQWGGIICAPFEPVAGLLEDCV
ncbi:SH3 domain-containing protein [Anianabacter salinae]|uniref:SH3 domain-containing protein n=1 Tax=Anianabacter salinae TaxID=2851023 RepID=UPI00225DE734|nr:SH3 domain-containing protein [Anianabacter salinae]MBV0912874.1 hypothetical protein [Anianabacter salinae]